MENHHAALWLCIHHSAWYVGRNFCGYLILRFFPNRKNSQNIVPANNSNNKVCSPLLFSLPTDTTEEERSCILLVHSSSPAAIQQGLAELLSCIHGDNSIWINGSGDGQLPRGLYCLKCKVYLLVTLDCTGFVFSSRCANRRFPKWRMSPTTIINWSRIGPPFWKWWIGPWSICMLTGAIPTGSSNIYEMVYSFAFIVSADDRHFVICNRRPSLWNWSVVMFFFLPPSCP